MSFENWNVYELTWTVTNVITLVITLYLGREAFADWRAVRKATTNGFRAMLAWGDVRRLALRAALQALFVFVGIVSGFVDPRPASGSVAVYGFEGAAFLLLLAAIGDYRERRAILDGMKPRRERKRGNPGA